MTESIIWQTKTVNIRDRLKHLYESKFCSDIDFEIKNEEGVTVGKSSAHKLIMAMTSPVFHSMLYGEDNAKEVIIQGVVFEAFEQVLRYIYLEETKFDNPTLALNTAFAAKKFHLENLYDACVNYFVHNLNVKNACSSYEAALALSHSELTNLSLDIIRINAQVILESENILELTEKSFLQFISNGYVTHVSKVTTIFQTAYRWCKNVCVKRGDVNITPQNVRAVLNPFLPHIEFLRMNFFDFVQDVCSTGVFTANEISEIGNAIQNKPRIEDIVHKPSVAFPEWCNGSFSDQSVTECLEMVVRKCINENLEDLEWKTTFSTTGPYAIIRGFNITSRVFKNSSLSAVFKATVTVNGMIQETTRLEKELKSLKMNEKCLIWFPLSSRVELPQGKNEVVIRVTVENRDALLGVLGPSNSLMKCGEEKLAYYKHLPTQLQFLVNFQDLVSALKYAPVESIVFFLERKYKIDAKNV